MHKSLRLTNECDFHENCFQVGDDSLRLRVHFHQHDGLTQFPLIHRPEIRLFTLRHEKENTNEMSCGLFSIRFRAPHKIGELSAAPVANQTDIVYMALKLIAQHACHNFWTLFFGLAGKQLLSTISFVLAIKYRSAKQRSWGPGDLRGELLDIQLARKATYPTSRNKISNCNENTFRISMHCRCPKTSHQLCINGINCYENIVSVPIDQLCGRGKWEIGL